MIRELASGQCRWVGREDVHVYCHAPAGRDARYCVVCPDEGLDYLPYDEWVTADEAEKIVDRILYARPKKRGAACAIA